MDTERATEKPYWALRQGIAPVKAEYVLWEKMRSGDSPRVFDDDAAEGRTKDNAPELVTSTPDTTRSISRNEEARLRTEGLPVPEEVDGEPAVKKVRLSGAQKKAAARERNEQAWQAKKAEKAARKPEAEAGAGQEGQGGAGRTKKNGQNKNRRFDHQAGVLIRLCTSTALGRPCPRQPNCRFSHDIAAYLLSREPDVPILDPDAETTTRICPGFLKTGWCSYGFKCRFGETHMRKLGEGEGFEGCGWELVLDEERAKKWDEERQLGWSDKGEMNLITADNIREVRGVGLTREQRYPLTTAYLRSIGEPLDVREAAAQGKRDNGGSGKASKPSEVSVSVPEVYEAVDDDEADVIPASTEHSSQTDVAAATAADTRPDVDLAAPRPVEKRRLDFRGKLYLAPLTTVGNLPFRRLAVELGSDITCSEMGLAQEFLNGNGNEWSLVRRHPSEKTFGVQICGSRPQALVPAAEAIVKQCDIDFLDINCGCPIDLVFNKGGGSALLGHAAKLGRSLVGMSRVLGDVPLTIKIRTGIQHSTPLAHKLVQKMQKEWEVSAVTLHGRSRQQRYKTKADYNYIAECARVLRETAADEGLAPIPIFGNGDAYDYRTYYENMESSGVDGIMIARGALVKPWIFTEIKERRDWDISSRERLDMVGKLASYGLEHWGSDTQGLNTTRRFLLEALSFQCRYVPVGLLERFPVQLNERAFPYRGRDELETLLGSDQSTDWIKISSMFLGPPPDGWSFQPKHKSNANGDADAQG